MQVIAVDERTNCQERHDPCFRVYLHESGGDTTFGAVATYDITGADVLQVIDWAQTQAEGWSRATGGARPTFRTLGFRALGPMERPKQHEPRRRREPRKGQDHQ